MLVAVARHGSVTAAAHALNYAQPSVSHHLARLEAETGTKLVQRAGRGIRLTDAGRLLAERAVEVIGRLDAAENELAVFAGLRAGRLRLAAFPSALGTIVPAAAAILHERHPSVDLRLTEAEPPEALRMLRAGYVDVALIFRHETADAGRAGHRGPAIGPPRASQHDGPAPAAEPRRPARAGAAVRGGAPDHAGHGGMRRRAAAGARGDRAVARRPGPAGGVPLDRRLRPLPRAPAAAVRVGRVHAADLVHHR